MLTRREFVAGLAALPLVNMIQKAGGPSKGKRVGPKKSAPNGLLLGLTESWMPGAGAMIGQQVGLDTGSDSNLAFVPQSLFPGGVALQNSGGPITIQSAASDLVGSIGNTDFLFVGWQLAGTGADEGIAIRIGENNANGLETYMSIKSIPGHATGSIPGADQNYPSVYTADQFMLQTAHMIAFWYTSSDRTLHMSIDGGAPAAFVNTDGIGAADPSNNVRFRFLGFSGIKQCGASSLWQGSAGVANAVSQLSSMYSGKLQYSDYDAG